MGVVDEEVAQAGAVRDEIGTDALAGDLVFPVRQDSRTIAFDRGGRGAVIDTELCRGQQRDGRSCSEDLEAWHAVYTFRQGRTIPPER